MASQRDRIKGSAERGAGKQFTKRPAPSPDEKTVAEIEEERQSQNERYGIPTSFRFQEETREALDAAARKHSVRKGDLAEFLIRAGIQLLEMGRIDLPIRDEVRQDRLRLPPAPRL